MKRKLSYLLSILAIATTLQAGSKFTEWSTPTNLGLVVNSTFGEQTPAISKDGLSLYFSSNRPGGVGDADLYVSQRSSVDEPWGTPMDVLALNSEDVDQAPALSRDGHYMFFVSNRDGGTGALDIYVSYRAQIHDDFGWEPPVEIKEINSAVNEGGPSYFENDGGRPQLYFQSQRAGGAGFADIYMSELQEDGTWSAPARVVELSSSFQDQKPAIRFDGLEIMIQSNRPPSVRFDLWVSTRESVTAPWSKPTLVNNVNSASNDTLPYLSGDGMALYFTSDRPVGAGPTDLWVSTRQRAHGNEEVHP